MERISQSDVEEIYDGNVPVSAIHIAHQFVERYLSDCGYSEDELKEFERWIAAHFSQASASEGAVQSERQGNRSITYAISSGKGFESTTYGQAAIAMDRCGKIADAGKRRASFAVL